MVSASIKVKFKASKSAALVPPIQQDLIKLGELAKRGIIKAIIADAESCTSEMRTSRPSHMN